MSPRPIDLKEGCLLTLKYFGYFRYPLTLEEIHRFCPVMASLEETSDALNELAGEGTVYYDDPFYLPRINDEWVETRLKGNEKALRMLARSGRYTSIIASFPFVRGVAISGSLSKYYASEDADIDYFIVTATERLWIARTLLHLFKKVTFITGHQHYFCMNYFVDASAMRITHRNLYSAVEVATLLPVYHVPVIRELFRRNEWTREYLPNHPGLSDFDFVLAEKRQPLKRLIELVIDMLFPRRLNLALMKLTDWKWRRKWRRSGYPAADYDHAFLTGPHVSKNHPLDYEKRILEALESKRTAVRIEA